MSEDYFIAKWKEYNNNAPKSDKKKHMAVGLTAMGASGYGGWKMGTETGNEMVRRYVARDTVGLAEPKGFKANAKEVGRSLKAASKTKGFRTGAAVAGAAVGASYLNDKHHEKKGTIVRKSADHTDSPFLTGEVSKSFTAPFKALGSAAGKNIPKQRGFYDGVSGRRNASLNAHRGSIPRNSSKFKLSDKLGPARDQKKAALAPYKGGVPKTRSSLPLQARKVSARLDNR